MHRLVIGWKYLQLIQNLLKFKFCSAHVNGSRKVLHLVNKYSDPREESILFALYLE